MADSKSQTTEEQVRVSLCPSTHCEQRGECCSPNECIVQRRMPNALERELKDKRPTEPRHLSQAKQRMMDGALRQSLRIIPDPKPDLGRIGKLAEELRCAGRAVANDMVRAPAGDAFEYRRSTNSYPPSGPGWQGRNARAMEAGKHANLYAPGTRDHVRWLARWETCDAEIEQEKMDASCGR